MYVELHAASAFSFLDGASLPEALVDRAADLGYSALALLDRDGVYGAPRFHLAARRAGIKALIGAELTLSAISGALLPAGGRVKPGARGAMRSSAGGRGAAGAAPSSPRSEQRLIQLPVLIESREGYRNLCRLITRMKLRAAKGEGALTFDDLDGSVGGLIALVGRTAIDGGRFGVGGLVDRIVGAFGTAQVYVELQRHLLREQEWDNQLLCDLAAAFHLPVLATNGARFAEPVNRPLYDVLTCIRHKTTLALAGRRLSCNAERYLKSPEAMARLFADRPQALAATRDLADRLEYTMADLGYRFPEYPVPGGETMASFLRKMTEIGARERYRPYDDRARRQIARELDLIEKLDLAGYFLIVWDIVNYCRQHDILVQGRGSAANSAVCYSLGITAVDPIGMDLLFERFLSEERGEWPDIDLDLPSGDRREQVIQHIYEKYGKLGAAMTANVITYRGRSAAREVGKVLSLEPAQIDRLARVMNHFEWIDPQDTLERHLREVGIDAHAPAVQLFGQLWQRIQDLPRHLGQHSGGMVMCQGRLDEVVPLENASMPGRVVVQWDKDDCADMGLIKVDLLGLGMMAVIQEALQLVNTGSAGAPAAAAEGESASPEAAGSGGGAPRPGKMMAVIQEALQLVNDQLPDSNSQLPTSNSQLPTSNSQLPTSNSQLPTSKSQLSNSNSRLSNDEHLEVGNWELGVDRGKPESVREARVDLAHLPPNDPAVYTMLQEADTVGIFQVESRAQMATLPRLKPSCFYDIVVEVAIIRPGPIVGQMVHPYLKRRQGAEPVAYPHPSLQPILQRTLGVPLFQEQLLRMAMVAAGFSGGEAEELRRAFGFKRSEKRMQLIEGKLRAGMERNGIAGDAAEEILRSITSFALYGFPESHAASFALLVYASAFLKAHYPAAFYTAMLNNQPMGFYHPATLVKDAQRRGVHFAPIDVLESDWLCRVDADGRVRLGLMYVNGLRADVGRAIGAGPGEREREWDPASMKERLRPERGMKKCSKCGCDDVSMIEATQEGGWFCNVCAHEWGGRTTAAGPQTAAAAARPRRFTSIEELIARTGIRRDELATLAEIGALNAFGHDRRSALWQIERAIRPAGELFAGTEAAEEGRGEAWRPRSNSDGWLPPSGGTLPATAGGDESPHDASSPLPPEGVSHGSQKAGGSYESPKGRGGATPHQPHDSPLRPMTPSERLLADYSGTSLTIGPHPLALRRMELAMRGVLRAIDLPRGRNGRRVRVAGAVITRQRPGTAKGFVFLTLEDETGIANIIVRPDLFTAQRQTIVGAPYLLVEGTLQLQEGVTSVKADRVLALTGGGPEPQSHDFR